MRSNIFNFFGKLLLNTKASSNLRFLTRERPPRHAAAPQWSCDLQAAQTSRVNRFLKVSTLVSFPSSLPSLMSCDSSTFRRCVVGWERHLCGDRVRRQQISHHALCRGADVTLCFTGTGGRNVHVCHLFVCSECHVTTRVTGSTLFLLFRVCTDRLD